MSVSRKDWSALSSLARQWTLEDEEEQERERRRRHRNLSSTTDDESPRFPQNGSQQTVDRLPSVGEAEVSKPPSQAAKDEVEDFQAILRTRRERRQRQQVAEVAQIPEPERLEAQEGRDGLGSEQPTQQPVVPKKEPEPPPRRRLSREKRGPWAQEEERLQGRDPAAEKGLGKEAAAPQKTTVSEKPSVPEKTSVPAKRLASEKPCVSEKSLATEKAPLTDKRSSPEHSVPERTSVSEKSPVPEKMRVSLKTVAPEKKSPPPPGKATVHNKIQERRLVSEKASLFERASVSETKPAPKKAAAPQQPQALGGSQATVREPRGRVFAAKSPPSSAEQGAPERAALTSRLPPITLQVKIPSKDEETDTSSPTQLTFSSSLKRSSPRTISFRMSPRKDNSETTLTRSASVRLPASSAKLEEKLERYHTAIQRSESVKSPGFSRTEFFVAPAGVASKRHLFEKELAGQSRAEPVSSRKEVRREVAVTKRAQWGNKSTTSLDAEV